MAFQSQNFNKGIIRNSTVQQIQAGRDAISFINSQDNNLIIENTFLRLFGRSTTAQVDWNWGRFLLEKKELPEIRQRLSDTLGRDRIFMDVTIEEQPSWVNRSPLTADRRLQIGGADCGILDPNKMLIETFGRDDIEGKLLILGEPGSGKTSALLSLAEQLVCGALANAKTVIPVLFELSAWRDHKQSIHDWLIDQMYDLHGGNRKRKIYEQWLESQILLPLLDGLDELGLQSQKECTDKLNEFSRNYPQMIICCRLKEFVSANIKMRYLRTAVCLQPLSDGQIQAYLNGIQRPELWLEMQTNSSLQTLLNPTPEGDPGLLRVPLFLKLMGEIFDPIDPIRSKQALLEKYTERQLSFDCRDHDRRKGLEARNWEYKTIEAEPRILEAQKTLVNLAKYMRSHNKVDFLVEDLQPDFSDEGEGGLILFPIILISLIGLIFGFLSAIIAKLPSIWIWAILGMIWWLYKGFFFGFYGNLLEQIRPITVFQNFMASKRVRRQIIAELANIRFKNMRAIEWIIQSIFFLPCTAFAYINNYDHKGDGLLEMWFIFYLSVWAATATNNFLVNLALLILVQSISASIYGAIAFSKNIELLNIKINSNQGIVDSFKNMLWTVLFLYPLSVISIVVYWLAHLADNGAERNYIWADLIKRIVPESLQVGWLLALLIAFFLGGGIPCIQHVSLRFILWNRGIIPLNLSSFLNYCVERRLLFRVGGRYRFIHRELLDHFAKTTAD
jgi:hypothetical protein